MKNFLDVIDKRYSVRTYADTPVEKDKLDAVNAFLKDNVQGPFGNKIRFELINELEGSEEELKKLVSYGIISGCKLFIAGAAPKAEKAMEDYGYCTEKNILFATSLGLGTVWLGGTFNRSGFANKINLKENEVLPCVSPIGYPSQNRTVMDRLLRTMSGGKRRKDFGHIFFADNASSPLTKEACGKYAEVLEAVRWAPSASNKQPWRIIKESGRDAYHFYLNENTVYNSAIKDIKMQNIDMGIAMCHFELSAQQLGLKGVWHTEKPALAAGSLVYITSWIG